MADSVRSGGVRVVALVAALLGCVHLVGGTYGVLTNALPSATVVLAGGQAVLGALLLPASIGLVRGAQWGRWIGVITFGAIAVLQLLPLLAGVTLAVPLAGILISGTCSLYLLLATDSFGQRDDGRPLNEDTDPHDFVR